MVNKENYYREYKGHTKWLSLLSSHFAIFFFFFFLAWHFSSGTSSSSSYPTSTSETSLSSIARAVPRHRAHLNSGSGRKGPLMPLHFLCTQRLQPPQKIALELPTPDRQTPQGYFPDFFSTSRLMPDSIIFVFPMFTRRPFFSISVFHVCTFTSSSSMDTALIIRSSAYSSSHRQPVRNSLDRASDTMMKSSGLRTEPWWTPTPTPNSSLYPSPTLTLLLTSLYMDWTRCTNHSSIPSLRIAHQMTSRGTRSNAFSRSTKAHAHYICIVCAKYQRASVSWFPHVCTIQVREMRQKLNNAAIALC